MPRPKRCVFRLRPKAGSLIAGPCGLRGGGVQRPLRGCKAPPAKQRAERGGEGTREPPPPPPPALSGTCRSGRWSRERSWARPWRGVSAQDDPDFSSPSSALPPSLGLGLTGPPTHSHSLTKSRCSHLCMKSCCAVRRLSCSWQLVKAQILGSNPCQSTSPSPRFGKGCFPCTSCKLLRQDTQGTGVS